MTTELYRDIILTDRLLSIPSFNFDGVVRAAPPEVKVDDSESEVSEEHIGEVVQRKKKKKVGFHDRKVNIQCFFKYIYILLYSQLEGE